jgi:asparagine synthase (glutamine-hydrolysing)
VRLIGVSWGFEPNPVCGFVGFWSAGAKTKSTAELSRVVSCMASALTLRGPDHAGAWADPSIGIALGHRRLAILDLSPAGHQPLRSNSGRFTISFNGEIYNHLAIRSELSSVGVRPEWRGHSDTESLLAAIEQWGVEATLPRCVGMFAFALWDANNRTLTLARDRIGEKPLYYGWSGYKGQHAFIFASELKAFRAYPGFNASISKPALSQYLRLAYVPAPLSIYEGIFKLEPGCMLTIKNSPPKTAPSNLLMAAQRYDSLEIKRWWSLSDSVLSGRANLYVDAAAAISMIESVLSESVRSQSLADVPLGAFLSGGVDSSIIVALMQSQSSRRVKTFTIGFDEEGFDESPYSLAVANHLGTDHQQMLVSAKMAQEIIPSLTWMYDEPFADSSQIPTHLVCKMARQSVTVALCGDGGDELFGGYNRYVLGPRIWNRLKWLPLPLRRVLGQLIGVVPIDVWDRASRITGLPLLGNKVHKYSSSLSSVDTLDNLYWSVLSYWDPASVVKGVTEVSLSTWESNLALPAGLNPVERMMFRDTVMYLPDDVLCKVDRAAMACSLETRVPFLDHRVVELAWQLPLNMKIRGNIGKWALRQVLYKYVPKELIERPKAGFAVPIGQWLRGPLRDWAEHLLGERRLRREGNFHPEPVREAWAEHLSGKRDYTTKLWAVLMFQAWNESHNKCP